MTRAEAPDLEAVRARLLAILAPYRATLETYDVYGMDTLRAHGARFHDWFAGVKPATKHVGFFLLPMHAHPDLLEGVSAELLRLRSGSSVFAVKRVDEAVMAELEALVRRAHATYLEGHPAAR